MAFQIITFQSVHWVLKSEKLLLEQGIRFDIIPTPKNISSDCGMSMRIDSTKFDIKIISEILIQNNIIHQFYQI
ncbi:MAG: hypothetical protein A2275_14965 [Bacteroidetes bacterium RIFOXYA12_FULL_35_11]|nr:MAG: hypothetical protein A2X01_13710 [Bacteroidetes bacterium GWF2_35_48]OFY81122.1 MAG: hypothetical protein A2275_14965 [Bacteroidetes bacterium RIFOXYA12_FULL_35_11]OFY95392.1 MAG: hypothetical protein A2491_02125 [Bacteroidetes bacterium RIFOXYC12_FULL_35_7]HBX52059.1 hypothetical protein [Bacteroidales bacterium]